MKWDSEAVFTDGDAYFEALERELAGARRSIDFETYIFDDDALGRRIAEALCQAAARGVRVRVMADGFGAPEWAARIAPELRRAGAEARVYHPLPWSLLVMLLVMPFSRLPWMKRFALKAANMNRRNHRKICLIDGWNAWLGSMNITADHLSAAKGGKGFRDIGVRVTGHAVGELSWAFERAWRTALGVARDDGHTLDWPEFKSIGRPAQASGLVRLNATYTLRRAMNRDFIDRIDATRTRVWITSAYFVPDNRQARALERAAARGVDVRIIVPQRSDVFFMSWLSRVFYRALYQSGANIFEFQKRILHAKSLLLDDTVIVGSSNLNHRSVLHDLEADVVLRREASLRALEVRFLDDQVHSHEMIPNGRRRRHWLERLAARLLFLLRYWL